MVALLAQFCTGETLTWKALTLYTAGERLRFFTAADAVLVPAEADAMKGFQPTRI
jgi:hypothetical protein